MSKLTDECLYEMWDDKYRSWIGGEQFESIARAIEAAATEPLLQRIAELERKSDQDDETIIWQAKEISEKTDKLAELERQLEEARSLLAISCNHHALIALRKDAERYRFIRDANRSPCIDGEIGMYAMESLDEYVDAAMEDEARIVRGAAMQKG